MRNSCIRLVPVYVILIRFFANCQPTNLRVVILDVYVEENVSDTGFGQISKVIF